MNPLVCNIFIKSGKKSNMIKNTNIIHCYRNISYLLLTNLKIKSKPHKINEKNNNISFHIDNNNYNRKLSVSTSSGKQTITEVEFHELSDKTLDNISDMITNALNSNDNSNKNNNDDDFDITSSQGVLTINLSDNGIWVLNKQTPNKQIWWSSPISGPKRYEYDSSSNSWISTKDKTTLIGLLQKEMKQAIGINIIT